MSFVLSTDGTISSVKQTEKIFDQQMSVGKVILTESYTPDRGHVKELL